jgi:hypothetical protein
MRTYNFYIHITVKWAACQAMHTFSRPYYMLVVAGSPHSFNHSFLCVSSSVTLLQDYAICCSATSFLLGSYYYLFNTLTDWCSYFCHMHFFYFWFFSHLDAMQVCHLVGYQHWNKRTPFFKLSLLYVACYLQNYTSCAYLYIYIYKQNSFSLHFLDNILHSFFSQIHTRIVHNWT